MIKIKFVDFWKGFKYEDNFFIDILSVKYKVIIDQEQPDFIFYSSFGREHLNYKCPRIFFSTENERPNMFKSDLAITMDYHSSKRHFRMPLFVYYLHQYRLSAKDLHSRNKTELISNWRSKDKFCCAVISNSNSELRNEFLEFLQTKEQIDSGGKFRNNVGGPVKDKLSFIKDYKFVIAFENSKFDGYTTEKILEPIIVGSIPLYWGNELVHKDFDSSSYIYVNNRKDFEKVYSKMKAIEANEELALSYLTCEKLLDNKYLDHSVLLNFIEEILSVKAIARSPISRLISKFIDLKWYLLDRINFKLGRNFR